jgi:hypothetical protein
MSMAPVELPVLPAVPSAGKAAAQPAARDRLVRRAKTLAWIGVAWHGVEATIAVGAGLAASSIALVGFGADSLIEALAPLPRCHHWPPLKPGSPEALGSPAAKSESRQTILCAYLSAGLLVGLGLNALAGWWWADPITALVIAGVAAKEGRDSWRGETCCATPPLGAAEHPTCDDNCCA